MPSRNRAAVIALHGTGSNRLGVERHARMLVRHGLSAGRGVEADINRVFLRRAGGSTEHWNVPDPAHASAIGTDPQGYERRVIAFLDRALSLRPRAWAVAARVTPRPSAAPPRKAPETR